MKKYLLYLSALFLLLTVTCSAKTAIIPGTGYNLNVWLLQGVQVKETPAEKSKTIATIPYGTSVKAIKETSPQKTLTVAIKSDAFKTLYQLKGQWIKIDFNGKTGYVFDGYLSAMPVLRKTAHESFESEDDYLKRSYGVLKIEKSSPKKGIEKTITYYKNGTVLRQSTAEGCVNVDLDLKNITFSEAVLFQNVLLTGADAAENPKIAQQPNHTIKLSYYACD